MSSESELLNGAADALRGAGFVVTVEQSAAHEFYAAGPGLELVIHLCEHFGDDVVTAMIGAVLASIPRTRRRRSGRVRQVAIEGPDGEVIDVVSIPDEGDVGAADDKE